jgi:DNA-binding NarL/FixJ family response regulator
MADMSETKTLRVMLVEDHIAFRESLAFLLRREPDLEVVAQASSLAQAREMLDTRLDVAVSEQARRVENKAIPQWAEGLYYNSGLIKEVLVYHDDEAIYIEHKGKESGIVRFTFEMIEGLKIIEEEQSADSAGVESPTSQNTPSSHSGE